MRWLVLMNWLKWRHGHSDQEVADNFIKGFFTYPWTRFLFCIWSINQWCYDIWYINENWYWTYNLYNILLKIINGNIAQKIVRNRVVFGLILTIHYLIKIERNRVPKKVKRTELCLTVLFDGIYLRKLYTLRFTVASTCRFLNSWSYVVDRLFLSLIMVLLVLSNFYVHYLLIC